MIGDQTPGGFIKVYNENLSFLMNSFKAHKGMIYRIKQLPNGLVATTSRDNTSKIWNPNTNWTLILTYRGHTDDVVGLEYINSSTIATGSNDFTIQIWLICAGTTLRTINTGQNVNALQLLSNGYSLAAGLGSSNINIYNINTGILISTLAGHKNDVWVLLFISNGNLLASASQDNDVKIWDLNTNTLKYTLTGHTGWAQGLTLISPSILASGSLDNTVKLWDLATGALIRTLSGHLDSVLFSVDMLSDGQTLASGSWDQTIKLWNVNTGACLKTFNSTIKIRAIAAINSTIESK